MIQTSRIPQWPKSLTFEAYLAYDARAGFHPKDSLKPSQIMTLWGHIRRILTAIGRLSIF